MIQTLTIEGSPYKDFYVKVRVTSEGLTSGVWFGPLQMADAFALVQIFSKEIPMVYESPHPEGTEP